MENNNTFKQQYKMGLDILKEDIEKCKQIEKLYDSLTMTVAIISKKFTPFSTKIKRSYERVKYKLTKRKNNYDL